MLILLNQLELAGLVPILTADLWEHAYYIDYRNAKEDYLQGLILQFFRAPYFSVRKINVFQQHTGTM